MSLWTIWQATVTNQINRDFNAHYLLTHKILVIGSKMNFFLIWRAFLRMSDECTFSSTIVSSDNCEMRATRLPSSILPLSTRYAEIYHPHLWLIVPFRKVKLMASFQSSFLSYWGNFSHDYKIVLFSQLHKYITPWFPEVQCRIHQDSPFPNLGWIHPLPYLFL